MNVAAGALGSVDVDVSANLDRLLRGFEEAEAAARRFDTALAKRVQQSADQARRATEALGNSERRLSRDMDGARASADRFSRDVKRAGDEAQAAGRKTDRAFSDVRRTLLASASLLTAAFGVNQIRNLADSYTRFTNQLKVAGIEGSRLGQTQEQLFQIAQRYGVELESLGTLHGRLMQSQRELNATSGQMEQFTTGVAAALKIQGASAEQARGALLQLTQAMGSPIVRAEEFNSVNEGARPILQAVANGIDRYRGSIARLRADVVEGRVTSQEFFQGFLRGSAQLETQAAQANMTIGQSFQTLNNALGRYIGQTDQAYSVTQRIGIAIAALANNLDVIMPILTAIIVAIGARYVAAMGAATVATFRKAAADAQATLAANALAATNGRVVSSLGAVNAANVLTAASSARLSASLTAVSASTMVANTRVGAMAVGMGVAATGARALGTALLSAMGGPVGVAILAVAGAVYYFHQRSAAAREEIERFENNGRTLNEVLAETQRYGRGAAGDFQQLGRSSANAAGPIRAFAGATGEAADQLYRLADARRKEAIERLRAAETAAREDREAASRRYQEGGQSPQSVARFGYLPGAGNPLYGPTAAQQQEQARIAEATRREEAARRERERIQGMPLEGFVPLARTGGRDIGAEIGAKQQELVAATRAGNESAMRLINSQLRVLRRTQQYLDQGLSLEVADAQARAEAMGSSEGGRRTPRYSSRQQAIGTAIGELRALGLRVGENDQAGGVTGNHPGMGNRAHGMFAVDINSRPGTGELNDPEQKARFDTLARQYQRRGFRVLWNGEIYEAGGNGPTGRIRQGANQHRDHMHMEAPQSIVGREMGRDADADTQAALYEAERQARERAVAVDREIAQAGDQILAARREQAVSAEEQERLEVEQINRARDRERDDIARRQSEGELNDVQAQQLTTANEQLRQMELSGVAIRRQERQISEAARVREEGHQRLLDTLDAERDMAETATERRRVERRILAARKEFERQSLQAIIDNPRASPLDRQLAQAGLASIDQRYAGSERSLNRSARDDLLGTAPEGSQTAFAQQADAIRQQEAERLAIVEEALAQRIILEEEAARRRVEIERDAHFQMMELDAARHQVSVQAAQSTAESLADIAKNLAGEQSAAYKAMFIASKAFAIADSIIQIQVAMAKALSLPFPANLPAIAQVAALGAGIVSNIMAVSAQFDRGGWTGYGARNQAAGTVHGQEFVVRAGPAARYRPMLESINAGRDPTAAMRGAAADQGGLAGGGSRRGLNVQVQNFAPGVRHEVQQIDEGRVRIIAREEAPKAVAADLDRPNSRTRKAIKRNTTATDRKR